MGESSVPLSPEASSGVGVAAVFGSDEEDVAIRFGNRGDAVDEAVDETALLPACVICGKSGCDVLLARPSSKNDEDNTTPVDNDAEMSEVVELVKSAELIA